MNKLNKIPKLLFCLFTVYLMSCTNTKQIDRWNTVKIDTSISKDSVYRKLDKQPEIFSATEDQDVLMKRTSDVAYFTGRKEGNEFSKLNNCRAYYFRSDTLSINIGLGNGFGGKGFIITCKDGKYYTEPYFSTDVIIEGEVKPTYKIVHQKLILDKQSYSLGDSLYGYIDFKSIETDADKKVYEHSGKGYFRTKVTKL